MNEPFHDMMRRAVAAGRELIDSEGEYHSLYIVLGADGEHDMFAFGSEPYRNEPEAMRAQAEYHSPFPVAVLVIVHWRTGVLDVGNQPGPESLHCHVTDGRAETRSDFAVYRDTTGQVMELRPIVLPGAADAEIGR